MRIRDLPAQAELLEIWSRDIDELTAVQSDAVRAGILDGHANMLVIAPTSSGKTLIGEFAAAQVAMTGQRHVFLVVPMKALAEEHFLRLRERYAALMHVVISTGDRLEYDDDIRHGTFDLAVLTYEKLAALIIQIPGLLSRCGCCVVDEGQMIADKHRGADLEVLITQVLLAPAAPRLIVLSASLNELNQLDGWLNAQAVVNSERPVPLVQAVCSASSGRALVSRPGQTVVEEAMAEPVADVEGLATRLALRLAADGKQVIVFRSTVPKTRALASRIASGRTATGVKSDINDLLLQLEDPDVVKELADLMACGVAFHNGDLAAEERKLVEDAFRGGQVQILVSTTTLAMGVNMPADVVIVADSDRPIAKPGGTWAFEAISVAEWRNAAGRAGRLGIRTEGLAILLAQDDVRRRQLFSHFVVGDVDVVESQIPKAPLHDVVFRLLAGNVAETEDALVEFICATFAFRTFYERNGGTDDVRSSVVAAVNGAIDSGLVVDRAGHLLATPVARSLAGAGVTLVTAVDMKLVIDRLQGENVHEADLMYAIASLPESGDRPYVPRGRVSRRTWDFSMHPQAEDGQLRKVLGAAVLHEHEQQRIEQTACLLNWMSGQPSRELYRDFKMPRERLRQMGVQAAWLLQTLARAARLAGVDSERVRFVRQKALEAQHGVPADLAGLAAIKPIGISRENLIDLRAKGIVERDDILDAAPEKLQPELSPLQIQRFKDAVLTETELSLRRKRAGHIRAANEAGIPIRLIETLYSATGTVLEDAVCDAFETSGLSAKRMRNQPHGEEDIQVATPNGTVVVSATGSLDGQKPIKWTKAQEVMGQGAGLNPVNCVCVGRPRFESLAERNAREIAKEHGHRKLLLIPVDVLVEAMLRCSHGELSLDAWAELISSSRGVLSLEDLPPVLPESWRPGDASINK